MYTLPQFGWTNNAIEATNHGHTADKQTVLISFLVDPLMYC